MERLRRQGADDVAAGVLVGSKGGRDSEIADGNRRRQHRGARSCTVLVSGAIGFIAVFFAVSPCARFTLVHPSPRVPVERIDVEVGRIPPNVSRCRTETAMRCPGVPLMPLIYVSPERARRWCLIGSRPTGAAGGAPALSARPPRRLGRTRDVDATRDMGDGQCSASTASSGRTGRGNIATHSWPTSTRTRPSGVVVLVTRAAGSASGPPVPRAWSPGSPPAGGLRGRRRSGRSSPPWHSTSGKIGSVESPVADGVPAAYGRPLARRGSGGAAGVALVRQGAAVSGHLASTLR